MPVAGDYGRGTMHGDRARRARRKGPRRDGTEGGGAGADPRPPPAAARSFRSMLGPGCRVFTDKGFIAAHKLAHAGPLRVWSGASWAVAKVVPTNHRHQTIEVTLSNGFTVVCGLQQTWACFNPATRGISAVSADELEAGREVYPFNCPLTPGAARPQTAYRRGWTLAAARPPAHLPKGFEADLPPAEVLAIAAGISDAQGGHLLVTNGAVPVMIMGLARAGVGPCMSVPSGMNNHEILIPRAARGLISEAQGVFDASRPVRVREVRKGTVQRCYRLVLLSYSDPQQGQEEVPKSAVVEMALLLAPAVFPDTSDSQSSSDSDSDGAATRTSVV